MASKFAALADPEGSSSSSSHRGVPAEGGAIAAAHGEPVEREDDEGYLDAFFHNHKPSRHLGAAAARQAARQRDQRQQADLEEAKPVSDEEDGDSVDEAVEDLQADLEDVGLEPEAGHGEGGVKRVSKKADRRAQRKQAKAQKKLQLEQPVEEPSAAAAPGALAVAPEDAAEAPGAAAASEAQAADGLDQGRPPSKADAKRQKELDRQARRLQHREAEEAEADQFTAEAGGILDARYRRRVLGCSADIAPVQGRPHVWEIARGFVPGMRAPARFFADEQLAALCLEEASQEARGGFLPAVKQLANVATLPGLMGCSLGMPDIHSGYGFAVGSVAAIDLTDPEAVVSPGGVGFDINCGVRLLRTELKERDLKGRRCAELATAIFEAVPAGVGAAGAFTPKNDKDLRAALQRGMHWALDRGLCWEEDLERTEEGGAMPDADPDAVSSRAMKRGSPQLGTLGSGNHYLELQVVDEIFDAEAARAMGLVLGNVCVMIHCGSRGLGHQLCTDYLQTMEATMKKQGISVPDRQLCCVRAKSPEGEQYLRGMAAAANFAFVNRTLIAHAVRETFRRVLGRDPKDDLQMHMVYDVAHNIAKREEHTDPADGKRKMALVHRKGATRSFPPGHEALPEVYKAIGQPVLIGGSMGTCSYVLAGNAESMELSLGSTCHGAGRRMSRAQSLRTISSQEVLAKLRAQGIEVRVASPKLVAEEADGSYKDVNSVVRTCHEVGISRLVAKLRPMAVIKG